MSIQEAAQNFVNSEEWESAIASNTRASWGGSGYSVELFEDGTFRVLWDGSIGNLYRSSGLIVGLPDADDDEADMNDSEVFSEAVSFTATEEKENFISMVAEQLSVNQDL